MKKIFLASGMLGIAFMSCNKQETKPVTATASTTPTTGAQYATLPSGRWFMGNGCQIMYNTNCIPDVVVTGHRMDLVTPVLDNGSPEQLYDLFNNVDFQDVFSQITGNAEFMKAINDHKWYSKLMKKTDNSIIYMFGSQEQLAAGEYDYVIPFHLN